MVVNAGMSEPLGCREKDNAVGLAFFGKSNAGAVTEAKKSDQERSLFQGVAGRGAGLKPALLLWMFADDQLVTSC